MVFERSQSRPQLPRYFHSHQCYLRSPRQEGTKAKTSAALKGRPSNNPVGNGGATKGRKATPSQLEGLRVGWGLSGPQSGSWKGGLTEKNYALRVSREYRNFRKAILGQNPQCSQCGNKERLEIHHLEPVSRNPARLLDETNVRVLCHDCHVLTPTYAGRANREVH